MKHCWYKQVIVLSAIYLVLTQSEQLLQEEVDQQQNDGNWMFYEEEFNVEEQKNKSQKDLENEKIIDAIFGPASQEAEYVKTSVQDPPPRDWKDKMQEDFQNIDINFNFEPQEYIDMMTKTQVTELFLNFLQAIDKQSDIFKKQSSNISLFEKWNNQQQQQGNQQPEQQSSDQTQATMDFMNSAMEYTYEYYEHQQESNNYQVEQMEQLAYLDGYDLLDKDDWTQKAYANDLENLQEMQEILEEEKQLLEQEMIEEQNDQPHQHQQDINFQVDIFRVFREQAENLQKLLDNMESVMISLPVALENIQNKIDQQNNQGGSADIPSVTVDESQDGGQYKSDETDNISQKDIEEDIWNTQPGLTRKKRQQMQHSVAQKNKEAAQSQAQQTDSTAPASVSVFSGFACFVLVFSAVAFYS